MALASANPVGSLLDILRHPVEYMNNMFNKFTSRPVNNMPNQQTRYNNMYNQPPPGYVARPNYYQQPPTIVSNNVPRQNYNQQQSYALPPNYAYAQPPVNYMQNQQSRYRSNRQPVVGNYQPNQGYYQTGQPQNIATPESIQNKINVPTENPDSFEVTTEILPAETTVTSVNDEVTTPTSTSVKSSTVTTVNVEEFTTIKNESDEDGITIAVTTFQPIVISEKEVEVTEEVVPNDNINIENERPTTTKENSEVEGSESVNIYDMRPYMAANSDVSLIFLL